MIPEKQLPIFYARSLRLTKGHCFHYIFLLQQLDPCLEFPLAVLASVSQVIAFKKEFKFSQTLLRIASKSSP